MSRPTYLTHLTLALAAVCLTSAELPFLPEMLPALVPYLLLVYLAWRVQGQWTLPVWAANVLGLVIAGGAVGWIYLRLGGEDTWMREVPLPGLVIPYLGPMLMALLLVRLFR